MPSDGSHRALARPVARVLIFSIIVMGTIVSNAVLAAGKPTLGWIEWGWLQPGHIKIKTKLDTGAKTSSIDATDIEAFKRNGDEWVRFRIPLAARPDDTNQPRDLHLERKVRRITKIKDHERKSALRYVVKLRLCIGGRTFLTPMTLADRGRFNYPLLLGRSALKKLAVVDAAKTFTASRSCPKPAPYRED